MAKRQSWAEMDKSGTVCAALAAFGTEQRDLRFALVLLVPTIAFWCLDGYYLRQERLFRFLYDDVRRGVIRDFELSTDAYKERCRWGDAMLAPTVWGVHLPVICAAELVLAVVALTG